MTERAGCTFSEGLTKVSHPTGDLEFSCDTTAKSMIFKIANALLATLDEDGLDLSALALKLGVETVAAAGSSITDAVQMSGTVSVSFVTGADGTKGAKLAAPQAGEVRLVVNTNASNALELYPSAGDTINGESAGTPFTIAAKGVVLCIGQTDDSAWWIAELAVAAV